MKKITLFLGFVLLIGCASTSRKDYTSELLRQQKSYEETRALADINNFQGKLKKLLGEIALKGGDQWQEILDNDQIYESTKEQLLEKIYTSRSKDAPSHWKNENYDEYLYSVVYLKRFEARNKPVGMVYIKSIPNPDNSLSVDLAYSVYAENGEDEIEKTTRITFFQKDGRYIETEKIIPNYKDIDYDAVIEKNEKTKVTEETEIPLEGPKGEKYILRFKHYFFYCVCHSWYSLEISRDNTVVWDVKGLVCGDVQYTFHDFNGDGVKEIFLYYKAHDTIGYAVIERKTE